MTELEKVFNPKAIEDPIYQEWESNGYFKPNGTGKPFSVVQPPPNVTGILHMGHALNITLQDIIVRYKRMNGFDTLWVPGTDHAGIATQNVVERHLAKDGIHRSDLGRTAFIERVWKWKEEYGNRITSQVRKMGASIDWSHERFTMDKGCSEAVLKTFVDLYNKGLIYRGRYLINWCPRCKTALSDVEVEHRDLQGHMWSIRYPFENDPTNGMIVATTRPETMFGDAAIAVHPDDPRYHHIIGQKVRIPLTNQLIPIIADTYVDMAFGTGAVKITPAHDFNDFEVGKRHQLEQVMVLTEDGKMADTVPVQFQGMDRFLCRKKLVADLQEQGYLIEIKDNPMAIGECYRCHTVVEPYLSWQWFVNMKALAQKSMDAVRSGQIRFIPKRWEKLYFEWMESIRDWCISRQIWWGHQIPVWYCENHPNEPIASETPLTVCPKCGSTQLTQEQDVLDTWFSSGLWPFETMGWPHKTSDLDRYYPTTLLITGYDILTFWVSRMITMGLEQTQTIPFSEVYIHGLVRDITGKKMSKSLGNALDPLELIDQYGTDALRYALASLTTLGGQDIKLSEDKIESARNFANKIWNSARYIFMNLDEASGVIDVNTALQSQNSANQWIVSVLFSKLTALNTALDQYNYSASADLLWEFIWNDFCDWYIEISKIEKEQSLPTLVFLLGHILKMLHPIMPFISETIWKNLTQHPKITGLPSVPLMLSAWPTVLSDRINPKIEANMAIVIAVIREIRNLRKEANIPPKINCKVTIVTPESQSLAALTDGRVTIQKLAKLADITLVNQLAEKPANSSAGVINDIQVFLSLDGVIDVEQERKRLSQQLQKLESELAFNQQKLANTGFINKAPAAVVDGIRQQVQKLQQEATLIKNQMGK